METGYDQEQQACQKYFGYFTPGGSKSAPLKLNAIKLPNILKVRVQAVS